MVALLLADGFEEVEAITPADFLRRAKLDVCLLGIGGLQIEGAHGITVAADQRIEDFEGEPEAVVLPGGMPGAENIAASEEALALVRKTFESGCLVAAICAAPAVALQKSGILEGKRVTCFPGFESRFQGCRFVEERVVVDGNLVTSRGAGTAAEFAIKIVEVLSGKSAAEDLYSRTLQNY
jgi:4-methyl-5(b-hydroxyethyl)-thiazole monophosphate biosynthesis